MILVDTSVWINYFKGREEVKRLDTFIETNSIVVNDLILAELLPFINQKKEYELRNLLLNIDVHSPGELRANITPQNLEDFYETFKIVKGDGMYREKDKRILIW